jgi:LmbE family N-acetylglucosaminyl deacetylase
MAPFDRSVAVIVAHPDDETLWAGGRILSQPTWGWFILSLCRESDADRAPKFHRALQILGATGAMQDLDDGPEQIPLDKKETEDTILGSLPGMQFDLVISHSPAGEYTRHRRHEETGEAVIKLWQEGKIRTRELWLFAYEDGGKAYRPRPIRSAPVYYELPTEIWQKKYDLITTTYGFPADGFEAQTTPRAESFWRFTKSTQADHWLRNKVFQHESSIIV